jgi:hypothetical protein
VEGLTASEKSGVSGLIVKTALATPPLALAVIVAKTWVAVIPVETLNVTVVCPAGTVTVFGTVATALVEERATISPPVGAGLVMVTVPVLLPASVTTVGLSESDVTLGARTVSVPTVL